MDSSQIFSLPGMIDVTGSAYQQSTQVAESLASYFAAQGYESVDTPIVEDADLFVRKSGGELSGMLYIFDDPGGNRVSLRPEFTPSVIRYYIEHGHVLPTSVRWQYRGPVFRYHPPGSGAPRQYTQLGAELIGVTGVEADVEVLQVAWRGLWKVGLDGHTMRISDAGLLNSILESKGLSETAKNFAINHVTDLKEDGGAIDDLVALATDMGMLRTEVEMEVGGNPITIGSGVTRNVIEEMLSESMSSPVGRRTTEQIVERLLRKLQRADQPEKLNVALGLVAELSRINAPPDEALAKAREVLERYEVDSVVLSGLGGLVDGLAASEIPIPSVVLDLGLVRGIAYYTGVVFEITAGEDGANIIGGGGRYDGLVKALGGEDVPAMGFAFSLDKIVDQLVTGTP